MAFIQHCVAAFLLLSLLAIIHADCNLMLGSSCKLDSVGDDVPSPPPPKIDCDEACSARCRLSSRPRLCKRACGTCCERCDCVPPGTSGNYDACPCYANMTTHGGRHKCP